MHEGFCWKNRCRHGGGERYRPRRLANDLTRPRLGVEIFEAETDDDGTVTGVSKTDYLGLTGNRIYVNINDTGVDDHDAFGRRLFGPSAGQDRHGHGTFVAGIIAGDGSGSGTIKTNPPPGSYEDPDFKGMAPKAKLHVLRADDYKVTTIYLITGCKPSQRLIITLKVRNRNMP